MIHNFGDEGSSNCEIRLYGDGSVEIYDPDQSYRTRTESNVIENDFAQRLSIKFGSSLDYRKILVNGQVVWESNTNGYVTDQPHGQYKENRLGADMSGSNNFVGGIDDVRIWTSASGVQSDQWIFEHMFEDLTKTETNIDACGVYYRFDDNSDTTVAINSGAATAPYTSMSNGGSAAEITGAQYQDNYGQLEEIQYSLGSGGTLSLDFDISGRIDTELVLAKREVRRTRSVL